MTEFIAQRREDKSYRNYKDPSSWVSATASELAALGRENWIEDDDDDDDEEDEFDIKNFGKGGYFLDGEDDGRFDMAALQAIFDRSMLNRSGRNNQVGESFSHALDDYDDGVDDFDDKSDEGFSQSAHSSNYASPVTIYVSIDNINFVHRYSLMEGVLGENDVDPITWTPVERSPEGYPLYEPQKGQFFRRVVHKEDSPVQYLYLIESGYLWGLREHFQGMGSSPSVVPTAVLFNATDISDDSDCQLEYMPLAEFWGCVPSSETTPTSAMCQIDDVTFVVEVADPASMISFSFTDD